MALVDNAWYVNFGDGATTGYYALTKWTNHTAVAGEIIRQFTTPAVGNERVFVCTKLGATGATEPTWVVTRGALNTSSVAIYQECTGVAALNGDATNTPSWTITATPPGGVKGTAVTLGQVIKRDSGASYQICTIAGTAGSGTEPAFSNTAGTTTADNTATWTSLGAVGNFTGWQAPHARLSNAMTATWGVAGNNFYLASEHAETSGAAITLSSPSTAASPCFVYSVNKTNVPPTSANLLSGAAITNTGNFKLSLNTTANGAPTYCRGVTFTFSNTTGSGNIAWSLLSCALVQNGSGGITLSPGSALENTTFSSPGGGSLAPISDHIVWKNTASALGTVPTNVLASSPVSGGMEIRGVDLSAAGAGKNLIGSGGSGTYTFIDCKLGASVTVAATPLQRMGPLVNLIRCDSGATNYRTERYWYEGTQTAETTIIRTGGATDGTTTESWKLVTTANSKWVFPFESFPISIWNDSTSAITTLTIYGTTTGGGVPNNDDIWVEVEYLGSALTPQGSFIASTKADNLAASGTTNNSSDASTWAGGGAGNGFKIVVPTFTPGMAGPINITVKVAKATTTYYVDPRPSISGIRVNKSAILAPGIYANELGSGISRARAASGF